MIVRPYGDAALLVEPDDPHQVLSLAAAVRSEPGVVEVVPAARTVLVSAPHDVLHRLEQRLPELGLEVPDHVTEEAPEVVLDVRYDGPDLADTAATAGLSVDELVRRHVAGDYTVAFCGFAPGFAYLAGLDPGLHVARLAEPRTRVPAGAVCIAGEFTGVYPRSSPGGWRLLGHTDALLWDTSRTPPALLSPGTRARFRLR